MNKLTEWLTKPFLEEDINIPVNVGDTILVGKFKNKKMVVKDIGVDDHGMPTINGRKATTFRMGKKVNIFDKEEIKEGVNDPGIFKVVFLAGGPGSGKTFVSRQLFGMPDSVNISMSGMKMVNSDKELKHLLNKYGFGTDLDNMPDELFRQLTDPTYKDYSGLRDYSKELTTQRMKQYRDGRLGMIIDGTGHKWKIVRKQKQELEKLGYDTYMIFVDTTLEVAQKRNQERDRILPPKLLEDSWKGVQKNRGAFKSLFKNNFIEIQNNETLNDKQIEKKFGSLARKYINVFMKRPIKNKIAKSWIKKQQILKKQGIKEFDIPSPSRKAVEKNKTDKMSGYKKVNEQKSKIKKVVGIYGGRFQPFGPHHKKTYEWLKKQVDEAYIVTSNLKSLPRHPMNFKEKVRHMTKMGIPKNRIIKETSPYKAVNTLKKFDEDTTAVIYIFGKKDAGRLKGGKYFDDYKKNKNKMTGYRDRGYILTAPHVSVSVGGKEVSGTTMRQLLGSPDYEKNREKLFKKAFGYFDKGIYTMMNNKFKKLFESLDDFLINNDMNKIIKEGSITVGSPVDDGPATFHKGFSDYKSNAGDWIKSMYKDTGWELVQYILGKHAVNPDYDYTLKYTIVPAVSYQSQGKYKKHIEDKVLKNLGYEIIKWMGLEDKGIDPEAPPLPGADGDTENTDLKERINLDEEVQLILEVDRMTLEEGVKFNNFLKDWAKTAKQPLDKVRKTMMNKNTFSIAKLNDFSVEKVFDSAKKGYKRASVVFHYLPDKLADKIQNTKVMKKKDEYLKQADEFLQKHPKTKKVVMLGAAATVTYMWTQMTFVGEPDYDFDLSGVAGAAVGAKNLKDLFGGTEGAKFLTLFATGKAMGLTIPYPGKTIAKFAVGITYGARKLYKQKKAQKADAEKKAKTSAPDTVKNPNPRGRKKTVGRKSAVRWVAKNKGTKAAQKYAKSLTETKLFTPDWWTQELDLNPQKKELLLMGGAAGHMSHPFDDNNLTFGDFKNIINMSLDGKLSREDNVTEKLDGQNLMVSYVDGELRGARNKGHLKMFGKTSLNIAGMKSVFSGRGDIEKAFVGSMKDLEKAIGALSDKQKEKVFGNGSKWMNLEIMYPATANVIDYDVSELFFHGSVEVHEDGTVKSQVKDSARMLEGMIRQANANIQKRFKVSKPVVLNLPKVQDFSKKKKYFLSKLRKLQAIYSLKDNDTLGMHNEMYWREYIFNGAKQHKYKIPRIVLESLVKRWAYLDKSFRLDKKNIKHDKFLSWTKGVDKFDHKKLAYENIKPLELLFLELGAEILKNLEGFLAVNPKKAVQKIKKDLKSAISGLRTSKDIKKIDLLKKNLNKINSIGGTQAIVPSEGLVFKYKGNMYKFTGAFAPVNQIVGALKF